mgnify:FL=1
MTRDCPECSPKSCTCSPCACGSGEAAGKCCGDRLKANRGDPDSFEKAWKIVKMPLSQESSDMFDEGICPQCEGRGEITVSSGTRDGFGGKLEDKRISVMTCPSCQGTGKPDPEIWGPEGIWAEDPYEWDDGREERQ